MRFPGASIVLSLLLCHGVWAGEVILVNKTQEVGGPEYLELESSTEEQAGLTAFEDEGIISLLEKQPGVYCPEFGGNASLFVRGTSSDHTACFLEGRRLNGGLARQYPISDIHPGGVGQVDSVNGATSTPYGAEGIGGAVLMNTRKVSVRNGCTGKLITSRGAYGKEHEAIDFELNEGPLSISASSQTKTAHQGVPNSKCRSVSILPHLAYRLNEAVSLQLLGLYTQKDEGLPGDNATQRFPRLEDFQKTKSWMVSPRIVFGDKDELSGNCFWAHSEHQLVARTNVQGNVSFNDSRALQDELSLQLEYGRLASWFFTGGVNAMNMDFSRQKLVGDQAKWERSWQELGVWGETQYTFDQGLSLSAGGRLTHYSAFDNPATFSLKVSQAFEAMTVFAQVASAYAPPTAMDLAYQGNRDERLQAERSLSWEFGVKRSFYEEHIQVQALVFQNTIHNLIDYRYNTAQGSFDTLNIGEALTEGLEFSARYALVDSFSAYANYTYLTALNKTTSLVNQAGGRLARRPRHQLNIGIILIPVRDFNIGAQLTSLFARQDVHATTFERIRGDDIAKLRIFASWGETEGMQVFGQLDNALNQRNAQAHGYPALGINGEIGVRLLW